MKKIIGLSAAICLLISVMAGFSAFAAEKTYYDIDFNSWNLNIGASTENAADILYDISDAATATPKDGWTLSGLTGSATVSTVEATSENAEWINRGKILKITGVPHDGTGEAGVSIKIPFEGYGISTSPYDTDRLILEYDVYIPGDNVSLTADKSQFNYAVFGEYSYNDLYHYRKTDTFYAYSRPLSNVTKNEDGSLNETHALGFIGPAMKIKNWYHIKWVVDAQDKTPYTFSGNTFTGLKTAQIFITDLATGTTTTEKQAIYSKRWIEKTFLLGGDHRKTGAPMKGVYYVDNFKLYKQNKFAFVSAVDDEATNVAMDKPYVDFTMNAPVDEDSLSAITLTGADETIETSADILEDGKTVRVNILGDMKYGTYYTVDFSGVKDTADRPVETEKTSITFTTEAAPALYVEETSMFSGAEAYLTPVDALGTNGLYTLAAKVKSTVDESKQATAIVAVYDSLGNLAHTTFVTKSIAARAEETIAAGMTIPAELAGGTVKVFLWNNVNSMQPYIKPITANIAAAE